MFSLLIISAVLVPVLLFLLKQIFKHLQIAYYVHKIPGPAPSSGFIPNNVEGLTQAPEIVFENTRKYSKEFYPIYKFYVSTFGGVNIVSPPDFELVMSNTKHNTKGNVYNLLHRWLGTGLLTSEGKKWQIRRKILTPAFHFNILQGFIKIFHEETERLVENIADECHKPHIEITNLISGFTLNSIGKTAMGSNFDTKTKEGQQYKQAVYEMGALIISKLGQPYLFNRLMPLIHPSFTEDKRVVKLLHKFTNAVIKEREKTFVPQEQQQETDDISYSKRKRLAMLDLLLTVKQEQGIIDDEGIREEVDTFMFEGHDTTSLAIGYALMLIAGHPDIQDRIVQEINDVLGDNKQPDYQLLQELKYLEQVIKEVLRLYPSVQTITRYLGEDMTTSTGYKLKEGTQVILHIYDIHRNPELYPNPEKFDPDRFLPENIKDRHPFAYVPFSAGSRNCIGQKFAMLELKAVLCGILSNFILKPIDTPKTIVLKTDLVLRTKDSIRVKFERRNK